LSFIDIRYKFHTVTSGEFRDYFLKYFECSPSGMERTVSVSGANSIDWADLLNLKLLTGKHDDKEGEIEGDKDTKEGKQAAAVVPVSISAEQKAAVAEFDWLEAYLSTGMPKEQPDFR
jgi:hypothetical protein